jgi:uncharacterized protein YuzE
MSVTVAQIEFDNVDYDREADVLYLHVGDPASATEFDETPEGHHLRFGRNGRIVGLTVVGPRHLLEAEGEVRITVPRADTIDVSELAGIGIRARPPR